MEKAHHHHENTPPRDDIAHCKSYFDRLQSDWCYEGFLSHCSLVGSFSFSLLNSRYIKSLEAIEGCRTETPDRRRKARLLIDRHKAGARWDRDKLAWVRLFACIANVGPPGADGCSLVRLPGGVHTGVGAQAAQLSRVRLLASSANAGPPGAEAYSAHQRRSKDAADIAQRTIVHGDIIGEVNTAGDFISAGGHVSINNTGRSTLKRAAPAIAGPSGSAKRRTPAPTTAGGVVCGGDMVRAGGSVEVNNSDRYWEETFTSSPPPAVDDTLPTDNDALSSPIPKEPYHPLSSSSPPPPQADDPYADTGDFPYRIDFVTSYLAMTHKRRFNSGKILEDHIFHKVRPTPPNSKWLHGNPILQWIVDLQDQVVATWFTKAEKAELQSWGPPLPLRDPAFEYAVDRFPKAPTSSEQLWDIIESPSRPPNEPYDRSRHSTANYVNSAAGSILSTIESYTTCPWLGPEALHEGWFGSNLWSPLIDRCLHGIPKLAVSRTEIKARSAQNGNLRFDAIIYAQLADDVVQEFGAIEVARVTAATAAGKQEGDAGKLVRVLRDMLAAVERAVQGDKDVMEKVQVVGIQNVGFKMNVWTMHMLGRNVAVLHRGHGRCVPMSVEEFGKVLDVMRAVVRAKWIVQRSMGAVVEWNEERRGREEDEL